MHNITRWFCVFIFLLPFLLVGCTSLPAKTLKSGEQTEGTLIAEKLAGAAEECYKRQINAADLTGLSAQAQSTFLIMQMVLVLTDRHPCAGGARAMTAYFRAQGQAAQANASMVNSGAMLLGIPVSIYAAGAAFAKNARAVQGNTSIDRSNFNFSNSGGSGSGVGPEGIPLADAGNQNRTMNVNIGGDQQTTTQTNFASGVIGQAEKQNLIKDSPNVNPILDDSGDGSGNEAGFLQ